MIDSREYRNDELREKVEMFVFPLSFLIHSEFQVNKKQVGCISFRVKGG